MNRDIKCILRIALPTPLHRLFDYLPPQSLDLKELVIGARIRVPFQSRTLIGILIEIAAISSIPEKKLKRALEVLDTNTIFPSDIYQLAQWAAEYYHYPVGEVLLGALPSALRKGDVLPPSVTHTNTALTSAPGSDAPLPLNAAQQNAIDAIRMALNQFQAFLLYGVTGSGKTEVYLRTIETVLSNGKQVLVLVPEISLTPQTITRFRARFQAPILILHSGISEKERMKAWIAARNGDVSIVIGTRSAIFTPFSALGLIIVDEEHDASFKQQDRFRYHARDLAVMRASINHLPIVLGSATPSLESLLNVQRKRYTCLSLPERAGGATLPRYHMLDLRRTSSETGLSPALINAMRDHLEQDNQVMLFLNRRGFAPVLYCCQCAWVAGCKRCDVRMVYHHQPLRLQCHHCDARKAIPEKCEQCGAAPLQPIGLGTQRLEQTLEKYFPDIPILRIDRDTTRRRGAMNEMFEHIHTHSKAILLGTQMLAKGHHFPRVTLVGIVDADSGLFSIDFRAAEQMGQLLLQVAGRAGRAEKPGTVVLQTRHPEHPLLHTLIHDGYSAFSTSLLLERESANLPPFSHLAVFCAEAYDAQVAKQFLETIKQLHTANTHSVMTLGPVPALIARRKGLHCQRLLLKATQRGALQQCLKNILQKLEALPGRLPVKWTLDIDPIET